MECGFKQAMIGPTLFYKRDGNDMIVISSNSTKIEKLWSKDFSSHNGSIH